MNHPSGLPVKDYRDIPATMFIRPRRPEDHREFEFLLPQMAAVFVYADEDGDQWVRWEMPRALAREIGWGDMQCACCGDASAVGTEHAVQVDTAWAEVGWWFNASKNLSDLP